MDRIFETARRAVNRLAKTFNCPRCGAPLAAGHCPNQCGGA